MLSVVYDERRYAECRYAECRYAECRFVDCHHAECRSTCNLQMFAINYCVSSLKAFPSKSTVCG
jgi:hypothetical protein